MRKQLGLLYNIFVRARYRHSIIQQTQSLRLVAPDPKYAPITTKWIGQKEVTQYLGADFSKMTEDDEIKHLKSMVDDDDRYSWMIERDGELVGSVEINEIKKLTERYGLKAGAFCTLIGESKIWGTRIRKLCQANCVQLGVF